MQEHDPEGLPGFGAEQVIIRGAGQVGQPGLETTHDMGGDDENFHEVTIQWRTFGVGCGKNFHTARSIVATSVDGGLLCYSCSQLQCRSCGRSVTKLESVEIGDEEVLCYPCDEAEGREFLIGLTIIAVLVGIAALIVWLVI